MNVNPVQLFDVESSTFTYIISYAWRGPQPKLIDIAVPANQNLGLPHGA